MANVEYTSTRHVLMQVVMWLVLAGAVGLAALVNHQAERRHRIVLSELLETDGLYFRLPAGWRLVPADDPRVVARAAEPRSGRVVSLLVDESRTRDAFDYLVLSRVLSPAYVTAMEAQTEPVQPLRFAGADGVLVAGARLTGPRQDQTIIYDVIACAVLPTGEAITVLLQGEGLYGAGDLALVRLLAEEVVVQ